MQVRIKQVISRSEESAWTKESLNSKMNPRFSNSSTVWQLLRREKPRSPEKTSSTPPNLFTAGQSTGRLMSRLRRITKLRLLTLALFCRLRSPSLINTKTQATVISNSSLLQGDSRIHMYICRARDQASISSRKEGVTAKSVVTLPLKLRFQSRNCLNQKNALNQPRWI